MSTTPNPILWDFYRQVQGATGLGGLFEYADTTSQSIYLNQGVKTQTAVVTEGHWEYALPSSEFLLFPEQYNQTDWEIPTPMFLGGSGRIGNNLYFIRSLGDFAQRGT